MKSLEPPFLPMEARLVETIPEGPQWLYEPKWDGFRCVAFRNGGSVKLQSKSGQPLERYFPEVVAALLELPAERFVLDGELVVPSNGAVDFEALLARIHPAASRVQKLSLETPATYLVFDLLEGVDGIPIVKKPLIARRPQLGAFAARNFRDDRIRLSPATSDRATVDRWFAMVGGALDGVIAKRVDLPYASGERTAMQKIKQIRTADCVVGGFRYASGRKTLGSILLGLYDDDGLLHYVGFTSGFAGTERIEVLKKLEALRESPGFTGNSPGGPSRWKSRDDDAWEAVRPECVLEVRFDQTTGRRFRHGTRPLRWRVDKALQSCTLDQLAHADGSPLELLR